VLLILGTNKQPSKPKHTNTQRKLARLAAYTAPVKLMACAGQTGDTGQAGGYSSCTTNVLESLNYFSRPWNKNTSKTLAQKKNPSLNLAKQLQTDQELTSNSTTQRHTRQVTHPRQIPQKAHTGQTGH
jgi:hypothetical protein